MNDPHGSTASTESVPAVRAGILGATGSTGRELARLLWRHPAVTIAFGTSRDGAGQTLDLIDPSAPALELVHPDAVDAGAVDVVFLCLPHGRSAGAAARCLEAGARVVDLSGDLRLRDEGLHDRVYGSERPRGLAATAVYGLTEVARAALPQARLVANPGCYPTCTALGLLPLVEGGHLVGEVVVNATSGVSGAGVKPTEKTHFCSAADDVRPYGLGRSHRHVAEMEQALADAAAGDSPLVIFNPHLVPLQRGMEATIVVRAPGLDAAGARALYTERYADEPFVRVLPEGAAARIRGVAHTNQADVAVHEVEGSEHLVVTSAIDNLVKGAAGQAVQNMNVMFGLPEAVGLPGFLAPTPTLQTA